MAQSVWNFVSTGDGARLCADALRTSQELGHCLAERKPVDMHKTKRALYFSLYSRVW